MLTRLHRFLFGPFPIPSPHLENKSFDAVKIDSAALAQLGAQLAAPGVTRSGLVVGHVEDGVLTIRYAIPAGYRAWRIPLLLGDTRYVLGQLDGLNAALDQPVDWYGHWLINPDNAPLSAADTELIIGQGQKRLLFSPDHLLLTVGERDGRLVVEAYRPIDGQIEALPAVMPHQEV